MTNASKKYIEEQIIDEQIIDEGFLDYLKSINIVGTVLVHLTVAVVMMLAHHKKTLRNSRLNPNLTKKMIDLIGDNKIEVYRTIGAVPNACTEGVSPNLYYNQALSDMLTEPEMIGVLCHEYGHYKEKHIIKRMLGGLTIGIGINVFLGYFKAKGFFAFLLNILNKILPNTIANLLLSQPEEYVADSYAIKYGYKKELISSLRKLENFAQHAACLDPNTHECEKKMETAARYSTHPSVKNRVEKLMASKEVQVIAASDNPSFISKMISSLRNKFSQEPENHED